MRDAAKADAEVSVENTVFENASVNTVEETESPTLSAAEKAFDLFDAGKLSELALLAAVGVSRDGYELVEDLRLRALTSFEEERLSEDGLIKVLG